MQTVERVEKVVFLIHPTCPCICASPDGFCFEIKTLIKVKYLIDKENEGFTAMLQKLSYLKCDIDASNNIVYELRKKHALYAEIQVNMYLLNSLKCNLILFNIKENYLLQS